MTAHRPDLEAFEAATRRALDVAIARARSNEDAPTFRRADAAALAAIPPISAAGKSLDEVMAALIERVFPFGMRTDHPRFFAFIPSPASPLSWLGELLTSVHNAHAGAALQSEGATAIEKSLIALLAGAAGLPEGAGGLFVSGGSIANLAALTAARDAVLAEADRPRAAAYMSSQTHSSVAKALNVIGVRRSLVRIVPVGADFRMDARALRETVEADRAAGLVPFVVAASAGATNTGAIDPLEPIADVCRALRLWMHVDGAYGASVLLSGRRGLLKGIERADSLSWDAHKWLFQTYGCGVVLVRDARTLLDAFRSGPDYLRDADAQGDPNYWDMGPELTRPARAVRLWLTLQAMGLDAVSGAIERGFALAEAIERDVSARDGWRIVSPAQMAIVAFRYAPEGLPDDAADALNAAVARRMLDDGFAVVGTTRLRGRLVLRMCAINPGTTNDDISGTIGRLDAYAREAARAAVS